MPPSPASTSPGAPTAAGAPSVSRASWEELLTAVLDGQAPLDLVAQPIVDLVTGDVAGYELLSRFGWPLTARDADAGLAATPPPDRWFAAAGRLGLAGDLTVAVLTRALEIRAGVPDRMFCTVNVGPEHLADPRVREVLDVDLERVVVELTEHSGAEPTPELADALAALRARGALIAVDDVGSGYAGLAQLLAVGPEIVKLDRRLTADVGSDRRRQELVRSLRDLSVRLGAVLLAEGVETYAECEALVRLGVPLGQGYFLGVPAQPWQPVTTEVRQWIRAVSRRARADESVGPLVRPFGDTSLLAAGPEVWVVRDLDGHPAAMVWRGHAGQLLTAPAVAVRDDLPVGDVLRRSLARPEPERWAPLAVVDEAGSLLGWVDLGEVVTRVAGAGEGARGEPRPPGIPRPRSG
ncbi:MAG: EAL domain-containing protein [Kineosporiaceae bacterium]